MLFIYCLVIFSLVSTISSYIFTGNQIRDLEGTGTSFDADAAQWSASVSLTSDLTTQCNGVDLLGGYGVLGTAGTNTRGAYFSRSYSGLPAHNNIRYSFTLYALDSWDSGSNDGYAYSFDGKVIDGLHLNFGLFSTPLCGISGYKDAADIRVFGSVQHSATTLTFRVISYLDEDPNNESFGIRDLILIFDKSPAATESDCSIGPTITSMPAGTACTCSEGSYNDAGTCKTCHNYCASCYGSGPDKCYACKKGTSSWDGYQCIACNGFCDDCFGAASTQCTTCKSGYSYFASGTTCLFDCPFPMTKTASGTAYTCTGCSTATDFLYWDKSCSSTCPAPFVESTLLNGMVKLCTYPCTPGSYLYWDGTCQSDCGKPLQVLTTKGANVCDYKCTAGQFLDWTQTCVTSCAYPLLQKTVKGKNFCVSPCNVPGEFIYWDQSCSSTCNDPLTQRTTNSLKYCDFTCATATDFLYWNKTCKATCNPPFKVRFERGKKFCDFPGNPSNYLYWDGTDAAACASPLTSWTEGTTPVMKFCGYKCNTWEYLYWNGSCIVDCNFPLTQRFQKGRQFCDYACTGSDFLYWNGTCRPSCLSPLKTRTEGTAKFCDFPTGNTDYFLYWDGSFSATCPAPLTQRIEGTSIIRKFCDFKCDNTIPEYLQYDGTCKTACNSPLVIRNQNSRLFCDFACNLQQFYYYNTSCLPTCNAPYVQRIVGLAKYCDHPCTNINDFLYWNNTCLPTCSTPPLQQQVISDVKWCLYPCTSYQFLSKEGICLDSCDAPFYPTTEAGFKYCNSPCPTGQYLMWNGTCLPSCASPLRTQTYGGWDMCALPCSDPKDYYYELTGECKKECNTTSIVVQNLYFVCLADRSDVTSFLDIALDAPLTSRATLVTFTPLTRYMRYIDLDYPPRFKKLSLTKGRSIVSLRFGQRMSDEMRATYPQYSIPSVFEERNLHSNFIVNFWEEITSWAIAILTAAGLMVLQLICRRMKLDSIGDVLEKLLIIVKWNYMIVLVGTSLQDVILFVCIQLRGLDLSSSFSSMSLELCLIVTSLSVMVLVGSFWLVRRFQAVREEGPPHKVSEFSVNWQGYQVLYRGFKTENHWLNSYFYLIYLSRMILIGLVASFLSSSPLSQTGIYMILSVLMTGYIAKMRPIVKTVNMIQLVIVEVILLIINASLFGLAFLDSKGRSDSSMGVMFGDIIVGGNAALNVVLLAFLFVKVGQAAVTIFKFQWSKRKGNISDWVQLLAFGVQQGGFGFEDISIHSDSDANRPELLSMNMNTGANRRYLRAKSSQILPETSSISKMASKGVIDGQPQTVSIVYESSPLINR